MTALYQPPNFRFKTEGGKKADKFRWHTKEGFELTAGGILPYDETGIWVVAETRKKSKEYTDLGGKYRFEDCDIYATIAREFSEELFFTAELRRSDVLKIANTFERVFVYGHDRNPVYMCYLVPSDYLKKEFGVDLVNATEEFPRARKDTLRSNPHVPPLYFSSLEFCHLNFEELKKESTPLSYRLRRIIRHSFLQYQTNRRLLLSCDVDRTPTPSPTPSPTPNNNYVHCFGQ